MQANVDLIFLCETWLGPEDKADCSLDTTWFSFGVFSRQSDAMLLSDISPESLPDKCNEFFVLKTEEIRSSFVPDRPIPTYPVEFSGTVFAEFQLVAEDFVKIIVQEMSEKSCDLDPMPTSVLYIVCMKVFPLWPVSIINKSLSSDIVPQCFKHALVKPLLKKRPVLIPTAWNTTTLFPICHFCQRYWNRSSLPTESVTALKLPCCM